MSYSAFSTQRYRPRKHVKLRRKRLSFIVLCFGMPPLSSRIVQRTEHSVVERFSRPQRETAGGFGTRVSVIALGIFQYRSMALNMTATLPMAHAFFLGIDVARTDSEDAGTVICSLLEKSQQDDTPEYRLDSIRSFDKTADPGEIAEQLQGLLVEAPYTARTSFVVNRASPRGQAIFDALDGLGLPVRAVTMTPSGSRAQRDSEAQRDEGSATDERTMEQDVVAALAQIHRDRTLTIQHRETDEAATLARNLQHYAALAVDTRDGDEEARDEAARDEAARDEAARDDESEEEGEALPTSFPPLVTSSALAVWFASQRSFDPASRLKETPNTTEEALT